MCKGSTADSDSVCLGSNPSSAAIGPDYFGAVFFEVWRSLVARFVRDEEVAGSNPVTSTSMSVHNGFKLWTLFFYNKTPSFSDDEVFYYSKQFRFDNSAILPERVCTVMSFSADHSRHIAGRCNSYDSCQSENITDRFSLFGICR